MMYRLKIINENMTMMTIIKLRQEGIANCNIRNLFMYRNGLTDSSTIRKISWVMTPQFELKTPNVRIGPNTFNNYKCSLCRIFAQNSE